MEALNWKRLDRRVWTWVLVSVLLLASAYFGPHASVRGLLPLGMAFGALLLLQWPMLGFPLLIVAALAVPLEFGTGTQVSLNPATLLIPVLFLLWLLDRMRERELRWASSRVNKPLLAFLLAGLLSLLVGNALWDPAVPKSNNFWMVQLAQWAIFAFSALAFWLLANVVRDEVWLRRVTWVFLGLGGGLAILWVLPGFGSLVRGITTAALIRAPFWVLLTALAGGQLLFNRDLGRGRRLFLLAVLGAVFTYTFILQREAASNWMGVMAVVGVLLWLRFPRLRRPVIVLLLVLLSSGVLFSTIYDFSGGDDEWAESGGSRLVLIQRVVEVTLRNPITGLGPASYRSYAGVEPLPYGHALWLHPQINSHNNYVDIFAHTGFLGLGLFLWFMGEVGWLGWKLRSHHRTDFAGGYVNGMFAAWVGSLVIMMLADWILPFVYNIGFPGFQASVLVWMFLGGLVMVEQLDQAEERSNVGTFKRWNVGTLER